MTVEEYRQRMINAFHNADCDNLIALVALPTKKEFEHLEWLLKNHYLNQKQQPCEDAVSRQEVMYALCDACELFHKNGEETCLTKCESYHFLATLPPVTPKEKTGHWITLKDEYGDVVEAVCSQCDKNGDYKWTYCPWCGVRMVSE